MDDEDEHRLLQDDDPVESSKSSIRLLNAWDSDLTGIEISTSSKSTSPCGLTSKTTHGHTVVKNSEMLGTKDSPNSRKREREQLTKNSGKATANTATKGSTTRGKTTRNKSAPKQTPAIADSFGNEKSNVPNSEQTNNEFQTALQDSFACLADNMARGFENLGKLLEGRVNTVSSAQSEAGSAAEVDVSDVEEFDEGPSAPKKPKLSEGSDIGENDQIIDMLGKAYNVDEGEGPTIHSNLAKIVDKLLKDKTEEAKLSETMKKYLTPANCERLAETRVNSPIWNNLSDRARTTDIKLQKVQKSLVRGVAAVVSVVNGLVTASEMLPKEETVSTLMDGVLLLANSNMELNVRRREALKPELHQSYRYLCAPSNPITTELFGDDLPKAVKDITDTNRITSKLQKERRDTRRGQGFERAPGYQRPHFTNFGRPKNMTRPFPYKGEGAKRQGKNRSRPKF